VWSGGMLGMFYLATAFSQDISPWCVALISSEPWGFDNAGTNPCWGYCSCPTFCSTGADGTECQNGGTATGATPDGSTVAATCSCTCAGESAAERACDASEPCEGASRARERAREAGACSGLSTERGGTGQRSSSSNSAFV
jgi:hypothetical protein